MKKYLNGVDVVSDLHKIGYTDDFQIFGNDLLWVQEKIFIRDGEFTIVECHKITRSKNNMDELIIFGIVAPRYNIKGILISHSNSKSINKPLVIEKNLRTVGASIQKSTIW